MRRLGVGASLVAAAITLAGCTAPPAVPAWSLSSPNSTPTSLGETPAANLTPLPTNAIVDEESGGTYAPHEVPVWDDASRQSVLTAAAAAMTAYARPDLPFDQWWAGLQPLLTQQATQDYAYIDPARIVATTVTGAGVLTDATSAYVGFVDVPTNAGTYRVVLTRTEAAAPWLTSRFILPEGVN